MASEKYQATIKELTEYFGVSQICAQYLYHRALRSKRKDDRFLPWNIKLQNALVKADKCLGINWEKVFFGQEEEYLLLHGIKVDDQLNAVFRWTALEESEESDPEWTLVVNKKKSKRAKNKNHAIKANTVGVFSL